ncbi:MAG: hypothetical protein GX660_04315 [Clostridiaceae bacterium]|nr:hypothetical protein [Clostridiaceae bacterium]
MGIRYDGHHSDEFGMVCKIKELPLLPKTRREKEDIPGRDGVYVYETGGFEEKKIVIECAYAPNLDFATRRNLSREVSAWLSAPSGDLILDKEPDKKYKARIDDSVDPSFFPYYDQFDIQFYVHPIAFIVDTTDSAKEYKDIVSSTVLEIQNGGTYNALPLIKINGSASALTITDDLNNNFTYSNLESEEIIIDCMNKLVYSVIEGIKTNKRSNFSGKYLSIKPGLNTVEVTGTITNVTITFIFDDCFL